jgi:DNA polymerase
MAEREKRFWKLLDSVEDYVRYGERTVHNEPGSVELPRPSGAARAASASRLGGAAASPGDTSADRNAAQEERPALPDHDNARARRLAMLEERVLACTRCPLHGERMNAVPGEGVLDPLVMVIGEGPGADEDRRGLPFVGRAGKYLDKWLAAIDLDRTKNAYIGNIVKCRPPGNRDPRPNETEACLPYLREQIDLIRPRAILSVGRIASGILIGTSTGITNLRGRLFYYEGIPLVPTFHPAAVLRNQDLRKPVWDGLRRLRQLLDEPPANNLQGE